MGKGVTDTYVPGRVGVVGLGLIGGSFAKAFAKAGSDVYAWNRTHEVTELACIDTITGELTDEVISTCELVIVSL
ncbi:MAG: NAD(P)-binding domain-containing protein, partial [Atopobiaceae bacterium]|nr:NAD(P)-binding domain-containing protein [Atopobiaceae bacterium]